MIYGCCWFILLLQSNTINCQTTHSSLDSIKWIWKRSNPLNENELSSTWNVQGRLGNKLENKDTISSIAFGDDGGMKLLGDFSQDLNLTIERRSNGLMELYLYPNLITDSLKLINGSIEINNAAVKAPFTVPAKDVFPTKLFAGWDGKNLFIFYPTIYLNNDVEFDDR